MVRAALLLIVCLANLPAGAAARAPVEPFEQAGAATSPNGVDLHVRNLLRDQGLEIAPPCSDAVFVRRVYLDVLGTLPTAEQVEAFLADRSANRRTALVDDLLTSEAFADYWSLKWGDLLRIKSEFPINLWPNAVQAYHRWVHESLRSNMPYDQFARELLTSSGSNFRVGPVNFYRALQGREPGALASAAALTFMGTRLDAWPADQRAEFEKLFSRVAFKPTAEWKEEIVMLDPSATWPLTVTMPDGTRLEVPADQDPRVAFADWLISPRNPWFARAIANRTWSWLMGRGIVHEPDDLRDDNPPVNPALLAMLEREVVRARYDLRQVMRLILTSQTYQQSSIPAEGVDPAEAERLFACYLVRRLEAEVLIDALNGLLGSSEKYESPVPEPFTYIPEDQRTILLSDGSISSAFLEMFGRPARDSGLEAERDNTPTDAQHLHLLNSTHIQKKIENSGWLRDLARQAKSDRDGVIDDLYLAILSRQPTTTEREAAGAYFQFDGIDDRAAVNDLAWALINGKEFLYRH